MRSVSAGGGQHHLAVARELHFTNAARPVGERDAANFRALARHHHDLGARVNPAIGPGKDGSIGGERDAIVRWRRTHGLVCRGPQRPGHNVVNIDPVPGRVARTVGAPAENVHLSAATVPAPRVREQHAIRLAAEQSDARFRRVRCVELACHRVRARRPDERIRGRAGLCGTSGVATRHPFIEQQRGRADSGIAQEPALPDALPALEIERVVQGEHRHANVVRHRGAHNGGTGGGVGSRVVQCVVESERSQRANTLHRGEIAQCLMRRDGEREGTRVRRDHEFAAQPAFEGEVGNAEGTVLIGVVPVTNVVRRLGHAPQHAPRVPVRDLAAHCRLMRLIEQRERPRGHDEHRHEVLEHAAAPRDERRAGVRGGERPAEMEPVFGRHIVLGNSNEARQARFRGEKIVRCRIEPSGARVIANGKEKPLLVVEQGEVHRHRQCASTPANFRQPRRVRALLFSECVAGRRERDEMTGEIAGVHRRGVRRIEHAQILQVVPVQQVPTHLGHLLHGIERMLEPLEHLAGGDETQVVRRDCGQQLQADIRWRRSRGDDRLRRLLEIVGNEPMGALAGKVLEKGPMRVREPQRHVALGRRQLQISPHDGLAQAMRNLRRGEPHGQQERQEHPASRAIMPCDRRGRHRADRQRRERNGRPHTSPDAAAPADARVLHLRRRLPLEQPAMRHEHAMDRSHNRIGRDERLMCQHGDAERQLLHRQ